jgi:death-on-curing protein
MAWEYISTADALAIHQILIRQYGGTDGVRDMGALESALHRPQTGYYKDIVEEAAALLESLAINHPFLDGNKRVTFAVTDIFLKISGFTIHGSSDEIYKKWMQLFDGNSFKYEELEPWLRKVVTKRKI